MELFKGISGASEKQISAFVVDRGLSVSLVLDSITIDGEYLGPIMEYWIFSWIS